MELKEKHCNGCDTTKSLSEFSKDKYRKDGYSFRCKLCRAKKQKIWVSKNPEAIKLLNDKNRDKRKEFYSSPKGKESSRRAHLKRKFGITLEEFNIMLQAQNNCCAICGGVETHDKHNVLAVDHCHVTGRIRGLLCYKCNAGLGLFNDNIITLINSINYLKTH